MDGEPEHLDPLIELPDGNSLPASVLIRRVQLLEQELNNVAFERQYSAYLRQQSDQIGKLIDLLTKGE